MWDRSGARLLTSSTEIKERWHEHFKNLLHCDGDVDLDSVLEGIPRNEEITGVNHPPNMQEFEAAIDSLKHGKTPGVDGISAEVIQAGGGALRTKLLSIMRRC